MKKLLAVSGVLVFVAFILGLAANPVNAPSVLPAGSGPSIQADGSPLPTPVPRLDVTPGDSALLADGSPLPTPVPRLDVTQGDSVLLADGSPLPTPIPHGFQASQA